MNVKSKYFLFVLAAIAATSLVPAAGSEGKIAFGSFPDGNYEIYVMNADGSGQTRLTNNEVRDLQPAFSPDGSKIAFTSLRDGNLEIYVMNADGTGQTRLTNNAASDTTPAFSPDGSKIVFASNRDGRGNIFIMNADGTGQTQLTNNATLNLFPAFSPDGLKITFTSFRDGNYEVFVINADGSGETNLTNNAADDNFPTFSPDGLKIAFASNRDGNHEIYEMNADGTGVTRLTNDSAADMFPAFSADGSMIAFMSIRDRDWEVYVMNADGSGQTNLTNNAAFDGNPSFPAAQIATVLPDSFSLFRGMLMGGGLGDLFASDDSWLRVRPGITLNQAERQVQLVVVGTAPTETPTELRIRLEAHASINNIGQWIELWNYDTNSWEQVDYMIATTVDSIVEVSITVDPGRFIQAGTKQMKAKVSYKEAGIVLTFPWLISFDQTVWVIVY